MPNQVDMGGLDLYVNNVYTGNTAPGAGASGKIGNASPTLTLTGTATTITNLPLIITTPAMTTTAAGTGAFVFTLTGLASGVPIQIQPMGGTNTLQNFTIIPTSTANTITATIFNNNSTALNGTVTFLMSFV